MKALGPERLRDLQYFQGGEPVFTLDEAIDLQSFPDNVLDLYNAFRRGIQPFRLVLMGVGLIGLARLGRGARA